MKDKFEYLKLPNVVKGKVTQFLPTKELLNLSITSKRNHLLFRTHEYLAPLLKARKFLHHVVRGNHEAVANMLGKYPSLMHIRGQVTDLSGRKFTNISGFEYALWALDKHMWSKMLNCLPKTKEGEKIKRVLRTQYQRIKEVGITYECHGVITQTPEKHFDFEGTIIKELQEFADKGNDNQWRTGVGGAQKLLPIHAVREYCSGTPFHPVPDFKEQPKSSTAFFNYSTKTKNESWFCEGSKLGINFAMCKPGWDVIGAPKLYHGKALEAGGQINAIKALCKVRTKDFLALENDLKPCNLSDTSARPPHLK